jgi:hypothetical protein
VANRLPVDKFDNCWIVEEAYVQNKLEKVAVVQACIWDVELPEWPVVLQHGLAGLVVDKQPVNMSANNQQLRNPGIRLLKLLNLEHLLHQKPTD